MSTFKLCFFSIAFVVACGSGGDKSGKVTLGSNPSVPMTCQMCLSQSSGNECAPKGKLCQDDPDCVMLNDCVNKCANINQSCVNSCGDAASADAIAEWNNFTDCTCGTCATQCAQTFCIGGGSGSGACIADGDACSTSQDCCTFCASDNYCGCIPSGNGPCNSNQDCCSGACGHGGACE